MNKRPLAPKFLNKLDNSLLLNRPDTWSTRFHLVIYYTLLFMVALAAICFVVPMDHREKSFFGLWSGAAGVLALIGLITWIVYLLRFNVFKQFGSVFPGDRIKTFLLYFFMIVMMMTVVYIPPVVECIRADHAYDSDELVTDMNRINELITKLEQDQIADEWKADTLIVIDRKNFQGIDVYEDGLQYVDTTEFRWKIEAADSVRKINSKLAIIYDFLDLRFVQDHRITDHSSVHFKTIRELYYGPYKTTDANPSQTLKELQPLLRKYSAKPWMDDYYNYESDVTYIGNSINERYRLSELNAGFDHIADRKYRLLTTDYSDIIHVTYYLALVLTLLIFIFRHSTIKTFFLSLLVGVVLSILSGLCAAVLNLREEGILWLMLFYFACFVIISSLIFSAQKRSLVSGIALNAFVLMTTFIPLIGVALYYKYDDYEPYSNINYYLEPEYIQYYANRNMHFFLAEIAGSIILLILIETLFKKLYRRWYAAPED